MLVIRIIVKVLKVCVIFWKYNLSTASNELWTIFPRIKGQIPSRHLGMKNKHSIIQIKIFSVSENKNLDVVFQCFYFSSRCMPCTSPWSYLPSLNYIVYNTDRNLFIRQIYFLTQHRNVFPRSIFLTCCFSYHVMFLLKYK